MRHRPPSAFWAVLSFASVSVAGSEVVAQAPDPVVLIYERGEGAAACPDETELRDAVAARLGWVPFRDDATRVVRARVVARGRRLEASVEALGPDGRVAGRREIQSASRDCDELARGVALAISVAIDPLSLVRPEPAPEPAPAPAPEPAIAEAPPSNEPAQDAPEPEPEPEPAVEAPAEEPTERPPEARRDDATRDPDGALVLGLAVGGSVGVVPRPRPVIEALAVFERARFALRAGARFDAPAEAEVQSGATARVLRVDGRLAACFAIEWFFTCGGVGVGAYDARGRDVANPRHRAVLSAVGALEVGVRSSATAPLVVFGTLGAEAPLAPVRFEVDDLEAWSSVPVAATLEVGVGWRNR